MHNTIEARSSKLIRRISLILIFLSALSLLYTSFFENLSSVIRIGINLILLIIAYALCRLNHLKPAKLIICLTPITFTMVIPIVFGTVLPQYLYWYPISAIGFSLLPYLFFDFDREKISFWVVLLYHLFVAFYIPMYLHTGEHSTPESRAILTTVSFRAAYGIILLLVNLCVMALVSINKFYESQITALNNSLEKIVEKRTSELMERNAQLSQYAYMNSHKVRGPLARILGLLSLLKEEIDENEKVEILDKLYKAAQELDVVVSDMNRKLNE